MASVGHEILPPGLNSCVLYLFQSELSITPLLILTTLTSLKTSPLKRTISLQAAAISAARASAAAELNAVRRRPPFYRTASLVQH